MFELFGKHWPTCLTSFLQNTKVHNLLAQVLSERDLVALALTSACFGLKAGLQASLSLEISNHCFRALPAVCLWYVVTANHTLHATVFDMSQTAMQLALSSGHRVTYYATC